MNTLQEKKVSFLRKKTLLRFMSTQGFLRGGWLTLVSIKIWQHCINCWGWIFRSGWRGGSWLGKFLGVQIWKESHCGESHRNTVNVLGHGHMTTHGKTRHHRPGPPFYRWGNWGLGRLGAFFKITQLVSNRHPNFLTFTSGLLDTE